MYEAEGKLNEMTANHAYRRQRVVVNNAMCRFNLLIQSLDLLLQLFDVLGGI